MTFEQFYDRLNGKMYAKVPPPVPYKFADYAVTNRSPINDAQTSHGLRPLSDEDMARYAADDVIAHYAQLHGGRNPARLGDPMSDHEFKKFMGQTWAENERLRSDDSHVG